MKNELLALSSIVRKIENDIGPEISQEILNNIEILNDKYNFMDVEIKSLYSMLNSQR